MENPKKLKIAVFCLSIALVVALGGLGFVVWQNHWWKRSVDLYADQAGAAQAASSFRRGQLVLWEINPTNDYPRFSGRRHGPFEVWLDEYHAMPEPWQYAQRRSVEAHNRKMRYMYEHPEKFKTNNIKAGDLKDIKDGP